MQQLEIRGSRPSCRLGQCWRTRGAFGMRTLGALGAILGVLGKPLTTFVAQAAALLPWMIWRTGGMLGPFLPALLLVTGWGGGVSHVRLRCPLTIAAARVAALVTYARRGREGGVALVAVPPNAHARLLVDVVFPAGPRPRPRQDQGLGEATVRDDGVELAALLGQSLLFLLARRLLLVGAFGRAAGTLLATPVAAVGAFVARAERVLAQVTGPVNAHTHRLLHAQHMTLARVPLVGLDADAEPLAQDPGALLVDLTTRYPGGALMRGRPGRRRGGGGGSGSRVSRAAEESILRGCTYGGDAASTVCGLVLGAGAVEADLERDSPDFFRIVLTRERF